MTDPTQLRTLDLTPVFGVRAQITADARETGGEYVEMDCTVQPGSGSIVHYHPRQEETYHVVDGVLEVLRDGDWRTVRAGESMAIAPGAVHAFRNRSSSPVRFINRHTPALGFQAHLETLDLLIRAGKIRGTTDLRSVIHMSMSAARHQPDVPVKPPAWLVRVMAFVGRRLGYSIDTDHTARAA
jgi:quercetin dioxygenase-like cupin family protein